MKRASSDGKQRRWRGSVADGKGAIAPLISPLPSVSAYPPASIRARTAVLTALFERAVACRRCPRLNDKHAIIGPQNGALGATVMFIAEAPGRFGADRSGIPLHGDATGRNFEWLLSTSGFSRSEVYVTNAVLCNPVDTGGRNAPPRTTEICNCADFLRGQIELVNPTLVVTLGAVALRAIGLIYRLALTLPNHHRKIVDLGGRFLVPLFHPSPRVMNTRRARDEQLGDFRFTRKILDRALRADVMRPGARV